MRSHEEKLVAELRDLPPELRARAMGFIMLLKQRGHDEEEESRQRYMRASEEAFSGIWDNDEDAVYDTL